MRCQNDMNYIAQIINDYVATLAPSARTAVEEKAQGAINAIKHELNLPLLPPLVNPTPEE